MNRGANYRHLDVQGLSFGVMGCVVVEVYRHNAQKDGSLLSSLFLPFEI